MAKSWPSAGAPWMPTGQDDRSKNMLVAVMLNMFHENMLRTPKPPFLGTSPQLRAIKSRSHAETATALSADDCKFGWGMITAPSLTGPLGFR